LPYLEPEHQSVVDIFMLAINNIQYSAMGKPIGLDMSTVVELVKLSNDSTPTETIEKVMYLSRELIRDGD